MNLRNLAFRPIASITLAVAVSLSISACGQSPPLTCQITPTPPPESKRTEQIVASLYVDATESMRGFVSIGSTTRYARIMDAIEGAISTGWNAQLERYQFGTKVINNTPMPKSSFQPKLASFYKSGNTPNFEHSQIDKALEHSTPGKDRLAIVITDLYQGDNDINAVIKPLSNYLKNGYSIGIVALKSEFVGTVYDVGLEKQRFNYTTQNKPEKDYHPFYLIVIGTQANIEHFFDVLKEDSQAKQAKIDSTENAKFVIFNTQLVRQISLLNLSNSEIIKPSQGRALERITGGLRTGNTTLRVEGNYQESIERLKVTKLTSEESGVRYEVEHTPLAGLPKISEQEIEVESSKFDDGKKAFIPDDQNLDRALKWEDWEIEQDKIKFKTTVDKSVLKQPGIYQFTASLMVQGLADEPWWEEWNGTENIVKTKDGSKTYNLYPFLQRLKNINFQAADKKIGQFCYAVQRE